MTGGAGFIGSHLCEKLIEKRHEVICLDNFFTGSKRNIDHLLDNHLFELSAIFWDFGSDRKVIRVDEAIFLSKGYREVICFKNDCILFLGL